MVATGGTDSIDIEVDSDYATHMVDVGHTEADIGSDIDYVVHIDSEAHIVIADFTTPGESHFVWPSLVPLQNP